jgi:hypothetical protein
LQPYAFPSKQRRQARRFRAERSPLVEEATGDVLKLSIERHAQIIACLVEGNSFRATCRLTHSSKDAVLKLVADAGEACLEYQRANLRGLTSKRI